MRTIDADIVCSRAKNHYSPGANLNPQDEPDQGSVSTAQANAQLKRFKDGFMPLHRNMRQLMYFS